MLITFSKHALNDRLNARLMALVTKQEVLSAIMSAESVIQSCREYAYISVKKFEKCIYLDDIVTADNPKGDEIIVKVAKVNRNQVNVITVILRKSTSKSDRYLNH